LYNRAEQKSLIGLKELSAHCRASRAAELRIGIGIASRVVIAGYTGTQQRATYTCVGVTVNLAARIEAHTKIAGGPILVDENTSKGLPGSITVQDLGLIQLKGKQQSVNVFSVIV
jgi:class 3 adenylate cyclase